MASGILSELGVSRETVVQLEAYVQLLVKWNQRINLVSKTTTDDAWRRHVEDSAQILLHAPAFSPHWLDLGSGGGLPGVVVAIIGFSQNRIGRITLVESDQRKCAFLSEVARRLSIPMSILNSRIEAIGPQSADVISARALADLSSLLSLSLPHLRPETTLLFAKGIRHGQEIDVARKEWNFQCSAHPSLTQSDAAVLEICGVSKKNEG